MRTPDQCKQSQAQFPEEHRARQTALAVPCQDIPRAPAGHAWATFPLTQPGPSNPIPRLTHHQSKAKLQQTAERSTKDKRKPSSVGSAAEQRSCHLILADPCCCSSRKPHRPPYTGTKSGGAPFYVGWCRWIRGCPMSQTHLSYVSWEFVYLQSSLNLFLQTPASPSGCLKPLTSYKNQLIVCYQAVLYDLTPIANKLNPLPFLSKSLSDSASIHPALSCQTGIIIPIIA